MPKLQLLTTILYNRSLNITIKKYHRSDTFFIIPAVNTFPLHHPPFCSSKEGKAVKKEENTIYKDYEEQKDEQKQIEKKDNTEKQVIKEDKEENNKKENNDNKKSKKNDDFFDSLVY